MYAGLCDDAPIILISVAKVVIPGIPLVNAVRNLLCGNEMNGIRQAAKAFIETMALAMGIYLAFWMFGLQEGMKHAVVVAGVNPFWVIPPSFLASVGFGSKSAAFEALGQGLSQNKVYNSPDVTKEMLSQPSSLDNGVADDDVRLALNAGMNVFS
jgi:hypothetical protein